MIDQFYGMDLGDKKIIIKEGETFSCGKHTLHFVMAPMVHWPEAMMTYDETDKVLSLPMHSVLSEHWTE